MFAFLVCCAQKRWFYLQLLRKKTFLKGSDHLVRRKFDLLSSERIFQTNNFLTVRATEILSWSYLHKPHETLSPPDEKEKINLVIHRMGKNNLLPFGELVVYWLLPPAQAAPSYTTISIEKILHYSWASYDKKVNKTKQQKHSRIVEKRCWQVLAAETFVRLDIVY